MSQEETAKHVEEMMEFVEERAQEFHKKFLVPLAVQIAHDPKYNQHDAILILSELHASLMVSHIEAMASVKEIVVGKEKITVDTFRMMLENLGLSERLAVVEKH